MGVLMENDDWENFIGTNNQFILSKSTEILRHSFPSSHLTILLQGKCSAIKVVFFIFFYLFLYYLLLKLLFLIIYLLLLLLFLLIIVIILLYYYLLFIIYYFILY